MERKRLILCVGTFVCGLVVGGLLVHSFSEHEEDDAEEKAAKTKTEYPQVYGVDVSFWQGNIRWDQLALPCDESGKVSGRIPVPLGQRPVQFAFIRATKCGNIVDTLFQKNYDEAKRLGVPRGAYHFLTDTVPGKAQAELFLSHAQFGPGDLPPVLDVEIDSPGIVAEAKEWLEVVEQACGVKAIIYTNMHTYYTWIKDDTVLNAHDLWIAKPRGDMPEVPNCRFWQFTHEGHVWGIIDNVVDINMFNGTRAELDEYIQTKGIKTHADS